MSEAKIRAVQTAPTAKLKPSVRIDRKGSGLEYQLIEIAEGGEKVLHESTKPIIISMARQWLSREADQ